MVRRQLRLRARARRLIQPRGKIRALYPVFRHVGRRVWLFSLELNWKSAD
jgi:hypothetical protein